MFENKKTTLLKSKPAVKKSASKGVPSVKGATSVGTDNPFVMSGMKEGVKTRSGNGALKYSSSGNMFVDQFAAVAMYKEPRKFSAISDDMKKLWAYSPNVTMRFLFYIRLVTRTVALPDGTKTENTQRGQGLKHEGIFRMMWVAINHPKVFWDNIPLFISAGSWKDIITMLQYDLVYNGWDDRKLDWNGFGNLILAGLENPNSANLIKKYLPQIKTLPMCKTVESQADTMIGKWIASLVFGIKDNESWSYARYRKLKTSGNAHNWQKLISQKKLLSIDFGSIHGRALAQLVSGKFLKNNNLTEKYQKWIAAQPVAKFTGFVFELVEKLTTTTEKYKQDTINAQFAKLVEVAKNGLELQDLRPISVIDCSGSMSSKMYVGSGKVGNMASIQVAFSSALFFDEMIMPGSPFKNTYLGFSGRTTMHQFSGSTFTERYLRSPRSGGGGTNFESVFDFFADFKRANPKVNENLIPNFILCWSDGEFNSVSGNPTTKTNVQRGREKLKAAGYSKKFCDSFGIGFVDLPNTFYGGRRDNKPKFETFGDVKNVFYFSGYDLSPLAFLFGTSGQKSLPTTPAEMFDAAMDQELFDYIRA